MSYKKLILGIILIMILLCLLSLAYAQEIDLENNKIVVSNKVWNVIADKNNFDTSIVANGALLIAKNDGVITIGSKGYKLAKATKILFKADTIDISLQNLFECNDGNLSLKNLTTLGAGWMILTINFTEENTVLYNLNLNKDYQFLNLETLRLEKKFLENNVAILNGYIISGLDNNIQKINSLNFNLKKKDKLRIVNNLPQILQNSNININGKIIKSKDYFLSLDAIKDSKGNVVAFVASGKEFQIDNKNFEGSIYYKDSSDFRLVDGSFEDAYYGISATGKNVAVTYGGDISLLKGNAVVIKNKDEGTIFQAKGELSLKTFELDCKLKKGGMDALLSEDKAVLKLSEDASVELAGLKIENGIQIQNKALFLKEIVKNRENSLFIAQGDNIIEINNAGNILLQNKGKKNKVAIFSYSDFEKEFIGSEENLNFLTPKERKKYLENKEKMRKAILEGFGAADPIEAISSEFYKIDPVAAEAATTAMVQVTEKVDLGEQLKQTGVGICRALFKKGIAYQCLSAAVPALRFPEDKIIYDITENKELSYEEKVGALVEAYKQGKIRKEDIADRCKYKMLLPKKARPKDIWIDVAENAGITDKDIEMAMRDEFLMVAGVSSGVQIVKGTTAGTAIASKAFSGEASSVIDDAARIITTEQKSSALAREIANAKHLEELSVIVNKYGGIESSVGRLTGENIDDAIAKLRLGEPGAARLLTRNQGLRQKALELLEAEKIRLGKAQDFVDLAPAIGETENAEFMLSEGRFWRIWGLGQKAPEQGIKIRVNADPENARDVFKIVYETCKKEKVQFKVPNGIQKLDALNLGAFGESQKGKFATIYVPNPETGAKIAKELNEKLIAKGLKPTVAPPNDIFIGESGMVSFRYASNKGFISANIKGYGTVEIPDNIIRKTPRAQLKNVLTEYFKDAEKANAAVEWLEAQEDYFINLYHQLE
ncbi:MAG: hypothetical protein QW622_03145 [Candidatus Pacearchaeota archaeon]